MAGIVQVVYVQKILAHTVVLIQKHVIKTLLQQKMMVVVNMNLMNVVYVVAPVLI